MVTITVTYGATGTACFNRPQLIGNTNYGSWLPSITGSEQDFDDNWGSFRFSPRFGSTFNGDPDGYIVQPGDQLEFDILIPTPETGDNPGDSNSSTGSDGAGTPWTDDTSRTTAMMGVDLKFLGGPWLSDIPAIDKASHIEIGFGDKLPVADGAWYHMVCDVGIDTFIGGVYKQGLAFFTLDRFELCINELAVHRYVMMVKNVFITNGGSPVHTIFAGFANTNYQNAVGASHNGGYGDYRVDFGFPQGVGVFGDLNVDGIITADELGGPYTSPGRIITATTATVVTSDSTVYGNATSANQTLTLFAANAVTAGRRISFINIHATHTLTISRGGSDTVNGTTTVGPFSQYAGVTLESDGISAWFTVP